MRSSLSPRWVTRVHPPLRSRRRPLRKKGLRKETRREGKARRREAREGGRPTGAGEAARPGLGGTNAAFPELSSLAACSGHRGGARAVLPTSQPQACPGGEVFRERGPQSSAPLTAVPTPRTGLSGSERQQEWPSEQEPRSQRRWKAPWHTLLLPPGSEVPECWGVL